MNEQTWKRKEYESWDEAFRGLSPVVRQQSVRVAAYTRELYVAACELRFCADTKKGEAQIRGSYADLAYKCGLYHQLGKALVPHEYQIWQKDFTEEERTVYEKYTTDGRLLVANLQQINSRAKDKRKGTYAEVPTQNIPNIMIRESCEQHMERYDGSGFPNGITGAQISPIAQIVGLAKELDRLAAETKSENPFDLAYTELESQVGIKWSEELIAVLKAAKEGCRVVYNKYLIYTLTIPKTIPLVEKRPDRKMGLKYRPMVSDLRGTVNMYEAIPWFAGIVDQPDETESAEELRELFKRTDLVESLSWYLLYEATDTVLRINNCKLPIKAVVLEMLPDFYSLKTQLQKFFQLFISQPIPKDQIWLTLPASTLMSLTKTSLEIVQRYTRNGIVLLLDDYRPGDFKVEDLKKWGIDHIRLAKEACLNRSTAEHVTELMADGFTVLGKDVDDQDLLSWLIATGATSVSGTITGAFVDEDGLIVDSLARDPSFR